MLHNQFRPISLLWSLRASQSGRRFYVLFTLRTQRRRKASVRSEDCRNTQFGTNCGRLPACPQSKSNTWRFSCPQHLCNIKPPDRELRIRKWRDSYRTYTGSTSYSHCDVLIYKQERSGLADMLISNVIDLSETVSDCLQQLLVCWQHEIRQQVVFQVLVTFGAACNMVSRNWRAMLAAAVVTLLSMLLP